MADPGSFWGGRFNEICSGKNFWGEGGHIQDSDFVIIFLQPILENQTFSKFTITATILKLREISTDKNKSFTVPKRFKSSFYDC